MQYLVIQPHIADQPQKFEVRPLGAAMLLKLAQRAFLSKNILMIKSPPVGYETRREFAADFAYHVLPRAFLGAAALFGTAYLLWGTEQDSAPSKPIAHHAQPYTHHHTQLVNPSNLELP